VNDDIRAICTPYFLFERAPAKDAIPAVQVIPQLGSFQIRDRKQRPEPNALKIKKMFVFGCRERNFISGVFV
jgi:hypothetical protein